MKKIVLIILLIIPFFVSAECNQEKHNEYIKVSSNITYDQDFSLSANAFTVTIYNIFNGMYVNCNDKLYYPNSENEVIISGVEGGSSLNILVYADDGCSAIKRITINEPYYNRYYGSKACAGYEEILVQCKNKFTNVEVTREVLDRAIENYNYEISQKTTPDPVEELTFLGKVKLFLTTWGIKILLFVITTVLALAFYSDKYRKVKHGI